MNLMERLFRGRVPSIQDITIDYDAPIALPSGTQGIIWDNPVGEGQTRFKLGQLVIEAMPQGVTYLEYQSQHPDVNFADARILEELLRPIAEKRDSDFGALMQRLLGGFSGQVFFLGTAFESLHSGEIMPSFAYLNWKTRYPALRYVCPADHPINHDVNCCACSII